MNKIKKLFSNMIESVKKSMNIFPITIFIIFVITIIVSFFKIGVTLSKENEEFINHILSIGTITAFGTLFAEAVFNNKKDLRRIIFYIFSLIIAIIFDRLLYNEIIKDEVVARWLVEYLIVCVLSTIYFLARKSQINFERYIFNVCKHLGEASGVFFITALGFLFIYFIFVLLILDTLEFNIFLKVLCIFTGFYYIPVIIKAFEGEDAEIDKFNKVIFVKVLLPLLLIAMLIIYIYIVKIFVITNVPNNRLFMILSVIFAFAFPIYIINKNLIEKDNTVYKINKLISFLYIPFIFLQIYALGIRLNEYGITTSRYMAIVFIIIEIFALFCSIYKESKYLRELILIAIGISLIVMITPFNYDRVSYLSQKAIVDNYVKNNIEFEKLTEEEKRRVAGAYQYIQWKEEYVNPELTEDEKDKLASYSTYIGWNSSYSDSIYNSAYEKTEYFNYYNKLESLNIEKYRKIYKLPYTYCFNDTVLEYSNSRVNINYDFNEYIENLISESKNDYQIGKSLFYQNQLIDINDKNSLYIESIGFNYNTSTEEISDVRVEGYILQK